MTDQKTTISRQKYPRITEDERQAALSAIGRQPKAHWVDLVNILGLEIEAEGYIDNPDILPRLEP